MSEFAPENDYGKLTVWPGLRLPKKFTTEQWNEITASVDPIVKGCILSCIYFTDKNAQIIQQEQIHRSLPTKVTRAVLRALTGNDRIFLDWLESSNTDIRKILPLYPNWSSGSERQFSLLMAAVKDDSWDMLIVFKNHEKRFVAPKVFSGKGLLKAHLESVSDTHFMGLMLSMNFQQNHGKPDTQIGLRILADPAIEELALSSVVKNELKVSHLLGYADLKFLKGSRPDIRQFSSEGPREAYFIIGDKSQKGLLIASYQQQAGVLGSLVCYGPFTVFDTTAFNQNFEMSIASHSLQPSKKKHLDYIDSCSSYVNIASNRNSSESEQLGKKLLKQACPTLEDPEGAEAVTVFTNQARLISAKQLDSEQTTTSWIAALELIRNNQDLEFNQLNDPILMIFRVTETPDSQGTESYNYRLQKMIIGMDCLQQELILLSSARPQNSVLYEPIIESIRKAKIYEETANQAIRLEMVSYFINSEDSESLDLLVKHNMGYCGLKILFPEDGCLIFDSDHEQEKSIRIFMVLKE